VFGFGGVGIIGASVVVVGALIVVVALVLLFYFV
jgi:hypothetical protein